MKGKYAGRRLCSWVGGEGNDDIDEALKKKNQEVAEEGGMTRKNGVSIRQRTWGRAGGAV